MIGTMSKGGLGGSARGRSACTLLDHQFS